MLKQKAHIAGVHPSFCSINRLGVFLLPRGWDASPSQDYPSALFYQYQFVHLGGEKHYESKVSYLRAEHNDPSRGLNPDHSIQRPASYTMLLHIMPSVALTL